MQIFPFYFIFIFLDHDSGESVGSHKRILEGKI